MSLLPIYHANIIKTVLISQNRYKYKSVQNLLELTCVELLCISGVGSYMHTTWSYAAAIFPVSLEQSTELIRI